MNSNIFKTSKKLNAILKKTLFLNLNYFKNVKVICKLHKLLIKSLLLEI